MQKFLPYLLLLIMVLPVQVEAQNSRQKLSQAKEFFYHEKYSEALAILSSSKKLSRQDKEARLLIAVCQFQLNHLDIALELLEEITGEKKEPYPECWLYMGKIYHAMHQFNEAADYYKLYLRTIRPDHPHRQMVREEIRRCSNGIDILYRQQLAIVENLGNGVNTAGDEFGPVPSRNNSNKLYFSSERFGNNGGPRDDQNRPDDRFGHFMSDMYSCAVTNGQWAGTEPMHYLLNSPQHEILLDFNSDGTVMYYFKGWSQRTGQIVADTFKTMENRTLNSTPFLAPVDVANGDKELFLYNDTLLIFSSRRPGGFGGYDLYKTVFLKGYWTAPENMGPNINSNYDETTPFLAPDGKALYFSSNDSRKSIGRMDIFKTVYNQKTGQWSAPFNMGLPLNSAGDDTGFRLTRDGFTAYLSSSRKDGFGERDIYIAYFQEYLPEVEPPVVAYVPPAPKVKEYEKPIIISKPTGFEEEDPFGQEEPVTPTVTNAADNSAYGPLFLDGNSRLSYAHKSKLEGIAGAISRDPALTVVVSVYTNRSGKVPQRLFRAINYAEEAADFLQDRGVSAKNIFMRALDGSKTGQTDPYVMEFAFSGMEGMTSRGELPVIGKDQRSATSTMVTSKGLFYKVQISSATKMLNRPVLDQQPYPMIEKLPDFAYYRYTVGAFERFEDAKAFALKMQRLGQKGAYVVPFIHGKRADKNEAKSNVREFPDLNNYLRG
ncbi:MAG: hypothetical protein DWQ02_02615 [Bacteroidetes bacterium]|nr:MAG: hypothetical protein DWQ02_02615 [Bacteroidota bacterium]